MIELTPNEAETLRPELIAALITTTCMLAGHYAEKLSRGEFCRWLAIAALFCLLLHTKGFELFTVRGDVVPLHANSKGVNEGPGCDRLGHTAQSAAPEAQKVRAGNVRQVNGDADRYGDFYAVHK